MKPNPYQPKHQADVSGHAAKASKDMAAMHKHMPMQPGGKAPAMPPPAHMPMKMPGC